MAMLSLCPSLSFPPGRAQAADAAVYLGGRPRKHELGSGDVRQERKTLRQQGLDVLTPAAGSHCPPPCSVRGLCSPSRGRWPAKYLHLC